MTPNLTACHRNYRTSHFLAELDIEILLSNFIQKIIFEIWGFRWYAFQCHRIYKLDDVRLKYFEKEMKYSKSLKETYNMMLHTILYLYIEIFDNV